MVYCCLSAYSSFHPPVNELTQQLNWFCFKMGPSSALVIPNQNSNTPKHSPSKLSAAVTTPGECLHQIETCSSPPPQCSDSAETHLLQTGRHGPQWIDKRGCHTPFFMAAPRPKGVRSTSIDILLGLASLSGLLSLIACGYCWGS